MIFISLIYIEFSNDLPKSELVRSDETLIQISDDFYFY